MRHKSGIVWPAIWTCSPRAYFGLEPLLCMPWRWRLSSAYFQSSTARLLHGVPVSGSISRSRFCTLRGGHGCRAGGRKSQRQIFLSGTRDRPDALTSARSQRLLARSVRIRGRWSLVRRGSCAVVRRFSVSTIQPSTMSNIIELIDGIDPLVNGKNADLIRIKLTRLRLQVIELDRQLSESRAAHDKSQADNRKIVREKNKQKADLAKLVDKERKHGAN
jgi:hypothetical protein